MQGRGGRRDGGDGGGDLCLWKGGSRDVLKGNILLRIVSKVLMDKGVLGGRREDIFLLVVVVFGLVGGNVGKKLEVVGGSGGNGGTGDDVGGGLGDIEERVVLDVVKGGPDELWRWGARRGSDGRGRAEGVGTRTWVIPGVEVQIENLKDCGSGVGDVLLINIIKGRPRSNGDLGEGRGGDDGGLGSVERHLLNN